MKVKIDTKEKFHVFTPEVPVLSANMTEELREKLLPYLETEIKNIILNVSAVKEIDEEASKEIANLQDQFKNRNASFLICEMQPAVQETFKQNNLFDQLNTTPTESEAWDIVQMEEIEREFFD